MDAGGSAAQTFPRRLSLGVCAPTSHTWRLYDCAGCRAERSDIPNEADAYARWCARGYDLRGRREVWFALAVARIRWPQRARDERWHFGRLDGVCACNH